MQICRLAGVSCMVGIKLKSLCEGYTSRTSLDGKASVIGFLP